MSPHAEDGWWHISVNLLTHSYLPWDISKTRWHANADVCLQHCTGSYAHDHLGPACAPSVQTQKPQYLRGSRPTCVGFFLISDPAGYE